MIIRMVLAVMFLMLVCFAADMDVLFHDNDNNDDDDDGDDGDDNDAYGDYENKEGEDEDDDGK